MSSAIGTIVNTDHNLRLNSIGLWSNSTSAADEPDNLLLLHSITAVKEQIQAHNRDAEAALPGTCLGSQTV